jgi:hypothetical protein
MSINIKFPLTIAGDRVSLLQVMCSNAGYYIGRSYLDEECDMAEFPYSRESGYMTKSDAEHALATEQFTVRSCIENDWSYDNNELPDIRD